MRPIIRRSRKPSRPPHHGGAWKLAYADFVTAMMAFFLLMWLLGTSSKAVLAGVAEYFNTPLSVALSGGPRHDSGASAIPGGGTDAARQDGTQERARSAQVTPTPTVGQARPGSTGPGATLTEAQRQARLLDRQRLDVLRQRLQRAIEASPGLRPYRDQILLDLVRDGLRVQIVDAQNRPMFANASAQPEPWLPALLQAIGRTLNEVPNDVVVEGHTDARTYADGDNGYSNWELSSDRANASRRELIAGGMAGSKVLRVQGLGTTRPLNRTDPLDPRNRRISILVLNQAAALRLLQDDPDAPESSDSIRPMPASAERHAGLTLTVP